MVQRSEGGSLTVRAGWLRALIASGVEGSFWNPASKSIHDAMWEYRPSHLITCSYDLDDAVEKCIRNRPDLGVSMFASAWGPLVDEIPLTYPIVRVTDEEKRRLEKLKKETGKPDFVFIHASGKWLEATMSGWRSIGIEPIGVLNGADLFVYGPTQPRPEFACDVGFCGARWNYKARNLDRFLLPLCQPDTGLRVKIFGRGGWTGTTPCFLGELGPTQESSLFCSAAVCANTSEPHSTDYGFDIVERPFKVAASGGFLISDHVEEMADVFGPDNVVMARAPAEFKEKVYYYLERPDERRVLADRLRQKVIAEHSYFNRVVQLLTAWNLTEEAAKCKTTHEEMLKTLSSTASASTT